MNFPLSNILSAPVVIAAIFASGPAHTEETCSLIRPPVDLEETPFPTPSINGVSAANDQPSGMPIQIPLESLAFGAREEKELQRLAVKRAMEQASPNEDERFEELQKSRRQHYLEASPDEVLADYHRHQMVLDAKNFLSRHVKFIASTR